MPGGNVYKYHTFNKETAPSSHETAQYKYMNISTIQVHEHYKTEQKTENTEENKINILPGVEPGPPNL
jgi:hypothetical protein